MNIGNIIDSLIDKASNLSRKYIFAGGVLAGLLATWVI